MRRTFLFCHRIVFRLLMTANNDWCNDNLCHAISRWKRGKIWIIYFCLNVFFCVFLFAFCQLCVCVQFIPQCIYTRNYFSWKKCHANVNQNLWFMWNCRKISSQVNWLDKELNCSRFLRLCVFFLLGYRFTSNRRQTWWFDYLTHVTFWNVLTKRRDETGKRLKFSREKKL